METGTRLGPYEIIAPLGAGGMGEVYRARDTRLGREVAIKVLPPQFADGVERVQRFEREARAASALNHPNIVTIYEVGAAGSLHWIAMEYLPGRDLREMLRTGPLPLSEALRIATQVAAGLAVAHAAGIVHRDLKPANIAVTREGLAKILDFGLARLADVHGGAGAPSDPTRETLATLPGTAMGTPGFMAPEQARGEPAQAASDQFAFGCVLHALLVGRSPFERANAGLSLAAALYEQAPDLPLTDPRVDDQLAATLRRCLAKDPRDRYPDTRELTQDLERLHLRLLLDTVTPKQATVGVPPSSSPVPSPRARPWRLVGPATAAVLAAVAIVVLWPNAGGWRTRLLGGPAASPIRSLAVLPLANLSGDSDQEYFADGMTDALINSLAQIGALSVISRTTVMQFKGTRLPPLPQIARQLNNVDAIVEGSVQRDGNRVRVAARLVRAATDTQLWAKDYQRDLSDVLALQSEVARAIADEIRVELTPGERNRLAASGRVNPEAYDLYLRGRAHSRHENREDNDEAIALLERSVTADPRFAAAHAELARAYGIRLFFFTPDDTRLDETSLSEVETALRLDPESSDAYLARALLLWRPRRHFPHEQVIRELRRALELNPSSDEAHHQLGLVYLHVGLLDRALREAQEAVRLNPGNTLALYRQGVVRLYQRDYKGAWDVFSRIPLDFNPVLVNYQNVWTLIYLGRKAEARARTDEYERAFPQDVGGLNASMQAILAADAGDRRRAEERIRAAVERGKGYGHFHHTEYNVATAYALLGDPARALEWLRAAAGDGLPCYPLFEKDQNLDRIRRDPGFITFLAEQRRLWEGFQKL